MRNWLKGLRGGFLALTFISLLVAGGLGWVTLAALRMESEQLVERAEKEHANRLRLALRQLDGYVAPLLAREDGRPFDQFSSVYAPTMLFDNDAHPFRAGSVVQPSPLLYADLPDWMTLHFQIDPHNGWTSPQVPGQELLDKLNHDESIIPLYNVTETRCRLLDQLASAIKHPQMLTDAQTRLGRGAVVQARAVILPAAPLALTNEGQQGGRGGNSANTNYLTNPSKELLQQDFAYREDIRNRFEQQQANPRLQRVARGVVDNTISGRNGGNLFGRGPDMTTVGSEVSVTLGRMAPFWYEGSDGTPRLLALRLVKAQDFPADRVFCQGVVLDPEILGRELLPQVADLFPHAALLAADDGDPDATLNRMTTLPLQLDPGAPPVVPEPGWTTLRIGLALAWTAALFAIVAVGVGGWTLIDLSERRIRFVSAVTHELRTPLTTLRLYLEMLLDGLVRDEQTRNEYLATLHAEAERLNRLVNNVLDYSRLEKTKPNLLVAPVRVGDLLGQVQSVWTPRCANSEKQLQLETLLPAETTLTTDAELVQQILGNLIDNACKYSRGAEDARLWLRARSEAGRIVVEVEDRGPGVAPQERRCIFNAFERGGSVDPSTGGVGLGLALAKRWAELLGGTLELAPASSEGGACFRLTLPA